MTRAMLESIRNASTDACLAKQKAQEAFDVRLHHLAERFATSADEMMAQLAHDLVQARSVHSRLQGHAEAAVIEWIRQDCREVPR